MSSSTRPTTSNRPYQGYPYVNPMVIDAPSIDSATASKWANLPRRPIAPVRRPEEVAVDVSAGEGSSGVLRSNNHEEQQPRGPIPAKKEPDDTPVVYIDLPEEGGSGVAQNREDSQGDEPSYVQETILYDPFENRRIDVSRGESTRSGESHKSESGSSVDSSDSEIPGRPTPPNTLNLATPGSSRTPTNTNPSPHVPPFLSKESYVYGRQTTQDDGFPLSPIPISEFPEPPPAYSEFDRVVNQTPTIVEQPRRHEQPRTQVILPQVGPTVPDVTSPIGLPNPNRKFLRCHHCGSNVHTMVIRETGVFTHLFAFIFFLLCFPIAILIYFTEAFKNKNHYCPNCNKLIGYEYPFIGQNISYSPS